MPRREPLSPGEFYHVFNRGVERRQIFSERENYLFFLRRLRELVYGEASNPRERNPESQRFRVSDGRVSDTRAGVILSYCLMPNHFHLLIRAETGFAAAMQAVGISYAKAINRRWERVGPLFQGRFRAIHVDRAEYLLQLSRYIHLNPVSAGLTRLPEDWEFSSYRDAIGLRNGTLAEPALILREFDTADAYRQFVESGIGRERKQIEHLTID